MRMSVTKVIRSGFVRGSFGAPFSCVSLSAAAVYPNVLMFDAVNIQASQRSISTKR